MLVCLIMIHVPVEGGLSDWTFFLLSSQLGSLIYLSTNIIPQDQVCVRDVIGKKKKKIKICKQ